MDGNLCELEIKVLGGIAGLIGQALNLDRIFDLVLEILSTHLSMNRGLIALRNGERHHLSVRAVHGMRGEPSGKDETRIDEGVAGLVFRFAEPFVIQEAGKEPLLLSRIGLRGLDKAHVADIGMPLMVDDSPVGVIQVDKLFGTNVSLAEDVRFLAVLAVLVARFIQLNDRIEARQRSLVRANRLLKADISGRWTAFFDAALSPPMIEATRLIKKVAPTSATVLLIGETGTGKRLAGRAVHELSERNSAPFFQVNISGKAEDVLEGEIFGNEKRSPVKTVDQGIGRVEEAEGGTLFLDEIGDLTMSLQAKLMRLLQDREFERTGSTAARTSDVRIIGSTTGDLNHAVERGRFRQDLYYRLNVFPINLPALRRRREDLRSLIGYFCGEMFREYGCDLQFSAEALHMLIHYSWPGNAREMENLIERLAITWDGEIIDVKDLHPFMGPQYDVVACEDPGRALSLEEVERERIVEALDRNNWVQSRAAGELGITLRQIGYRLKKFGLEDFVKMRRAQRRQSRDEAHP
ncbi:MAG: sigma 54-interacting transcriptional regulator [Pseudomonadota bacterium]